MITTNHLGQPRPVIITRYLAIAMSDTRDRYPGLYRKLFFRLSDLWKGYDWL